MSEDKDKEISPALENKEDKIIGEEGEDKTDVKEKDTDTQTDLYEQKLAELEKQGIQKTAAIKEKNKKIQDLKAQLDKKLELSEDGTITADVLIEQINALKEEIKGIKGESQSTKEEILKTALEDKIDRKIGNASANEGEQKIIRFFFEKKTNPNLSLEERVQHAIVLARQTLVSDDRFKEDVERANQAAVRTKGQAENKTSGWSDEARSFANKVLQTDKGKQIFEDIGKDRLRK